MSGSFDLYEYLAYFLVYSFLGWCVEVVYAALNTGKIINRGFLNGPVCPIYGFGMTAILLFFSTVLGLDENGSTILLFLGGMFITTAIELIGGAVLYRAFNIRWWDYTGRPFNFKGYICLQFSIIWGLGTVFMYKIVHPSVYALTIGWLPKKAGIIIMVLCYLVYAADTVLTVAILIGLNRRLSELDELKAQMRSFSDGLSERLGESAIKNANAIERAKVQASLAGMERRDDFMARREEAEKKYYAFKDNAEQKYEEIKSGAEQRRAEKLKQMEERYGLLKKKLIRNRVFGLHRLLRSYPGSHHFKYADIFDELKKDDYDRK